MSVSSTPRVVGYVRVTAADQSNHALSHEREALSRPWLPFGEGDPVPAVSRFYEDDGQSGVSPWEARPGLSALMRDAGRGDFDVVRVATMDRLSRSRADAADIIDRLEELGVQVHADDHEPTSPFGLPMFKLLASAAREERRLIDERIAEQEGAL